VTSATDWLAQVKAAERRGELLAAYDLADQGLAEHPGDLWLQHRAVLALARSGATRQATQRYLAYDLARAAHEEDVAALAARIAKDRALEATDARRVALAAEAAALYAAVHARTGGYYPAINAATLSLLAGRSEAARRLAAEARRQAGQGTDEPYYRAATLAEAALILGDRAAATAALARAAAVHGGDLAAVATTRRQLRLVAALTGTEPTVLAPLAAPAVVHFCGHMMSPPGRAGRFETTAEARVAADIARTLAQHRVGYGYGSLASGADILFAEALLAAGAELHVVLPFDRADFVALSVVPAGGDWVARFERCLAAARTVSYATEDHHLGDDALFAYAARLAMGLALLRGRYLDADVAQVAVWDGGPPGGVSGTTVDIGTWRATGRPSITIASHGSAVPAPRALADPARRRVPRAMLFGDVKGFSKLTEREMPAFVEVVLGGLAAAVARHAAHVLFRNTWGDGVFVVLDDVAIAARCALDLQQAFAAIDLAAAGLPAHLGLRLGGHQGPVYEFTDPLLGRPNFFGAHVSRTARIEPVTPVGEVYVTEMFAAALALSADTAFACDYVGHMPAAKGYGNLRMYLLRERGG